MPSCSTSSSRRDSDDCSSTTTRYASGRLLHVVGDAEVEAGRPRHAAEDEGVGVLEDRGVDAARHDPGHGVGHLAERGEGDEHGGGLGRPGLHLHGHLGRHGQRPLRADEQLRQVVAGRALHELPAGAQHPAVGQDDLEPEDVVAGHAVADGAHAAGVGPDVAAERGALLAGGHRIGQAERQELRVELFEGHARLDDGDLVLGVDLADAVHPVEGQQDAVGHGHGGAREPGAAAAGDDGHPVFGGQAQHLGDLVRRARQYEGQRDHGRDGQGLVVGVVGVDGLADADVALAHGLAQLFQEIRHATATPTSGRSGGPTLPGRRRRPRFPPPAVVAARPPVRTPRMPPSAPPPSGAGPRSARSAPATGSARGRRRRRGRRPTARTSCTTARPRSGSSAT